LCGVRHENLNNDGLNVLRSFYTDVKFISSKVTELWRDFSKHRVTRVKHLDCHMTEIKGGIISSVMKQLAVLLSTWWVIITWQSCLHVIVTVYIPEHGSLRNL